MTAVKALLYVLMAVVGSSAAVFTADGWAGSAWWNVVVVAVGAFGVWWKANTPTQPWAKCIVAVFTAGAAVLVSAWTDRVIEPVELQQIGLAILGAALVGAGQNNITTPGPRPDLGAVPVRTVLGLSAVAVLVLIAIPASASAEHHRSGPLAPVVTSADVCEGTLTVRFSSYALAGRTWQTRLDDGRAQLELLEVSGRSGPGGSWQTPEGVGSGGEGSLRWAEYEEATAQGQHYEMARVLVGGYRSERVPVEDRCVE